MYKGSFKALSPHLQIYKFPVAVWMSILHRLTGLFLFLSILVLVWVLYALNYFNKDSFLYCFADCFYSGCLYDISLLLVFSSLMFHFFCGMRYIVWGFGKLVDIKGIAIMNWAVIFATIISISVYICYLYI